MWGNPLGWSISACIVIVTVAALVWVSQTLNTISDPTPFSTQSGVADVLSVPVVPAAALPDHHADGDTGARYHQAIALYEQNKTVFNEFAARPNKRDLPAVAPAIDLLRKAAGNDSLGLFTATPEQAVSYDASSPLMELIALGRCTANAALFAKAHGKTDDAIADLQAAASLGQRMVDERLCYAELSGGLGLLSSSAIELAELANDAGDQARADALNHFAADLSDYSQKKLLPIETVLSSVDQATIERSAGDLFWVAKNSKERLWRIEAIHALGRLHYNAGRPGDNRGAYRVLGEIAATDPDAIIKLAAQQGHDLTTADYNSLH
jgi:hypothetical protein